jgi:GTP cyclohydrolase I
VEVVLSSFVTAAEASQERGHNLVVVSVPFFEHCEHHYRYKLHVNFLGFLKDFLN